MAYREIDQEEVDLLYEIYIDAPLNSKGLPSVSYTANKGQVKRATIEHLRDVHKWDERRQERLADAEKKADAEWLKQRRAKIRKVTALDNAGLNYLSRQVQDGALEITTNESINWGKYLLLLQGEPDSFPGAPPTTGSNCKTVEERRQLVTELAEDMHDLDVKLNGKESDEDDKESTE